MKIPAYARYDYCNQRACEFLEENNICSFPFDVKRIIHNSGWGLVTYSELMHQFSCDRNTVIRCLGSEDGYTQLDDVNYCIAYNDEGWLGDRIRFTLMHEIGHIYLRHLADFEATRLYRGSLTKQENKVLENEANAFARNVLVPTAMLQRLKNKSASNISNHFGITLAAAQTRLNFFYEDNRINKQNGTSSRLYTIFYNFYYKKKCTTCGYFIISKSIKYCPICGNKTLQWGESEMKYPVKIKLDENSKAVCCPKCDNEEVSPDGNYCHICGTYLINECTNYDGNYLEGCGRLAASNARYCIYCGAPTTFLQNGILKPWDFKENYNTFMSLPDTLDSEDEPLPFN